MTDPTTTAVRLEPMTPAGFDTWAAHSVEGFADQQVRAGLQPGPEARAHAARAFAALLPDGLATVSHHVWTVLAGDEQVGHLWLRVRPLSTEVEGYVYDIELAPSARGRGLGRATMLAAEEAARGLGATVMRLNVFGHNTTAVRLYQQLGYVVARAALAKRIDPATRDDGRVQLREMTAATYAAFRRRLDTEHAADLARSGTLPLQEARRQVADDAAWLLPWGRTSPGQLLRTAYDGQQPVADVWLQVQERTDGPHAEVRQLVLPDPARGPEVVGAVEQLCRDRGVVSVGLSVLGVDTLGRATYEGCGFGLTAQTMVKPL